MRRPKAIGSTGLERNIGLLTNTEVLPGFRLVAIDVDRDEFVRIFEAVLGCPVSGKRGKKGATFFGLARIEEKVRKTVIKDHEGKPVADVLAGHSHTVIPPSIHPDTGEEYRWIGKPLLDCQWDELPIVGLRQLKILSLIVRSEFALALLTGQGTHDPGTRLVAQIVKLCSDDEIRRFFPALLPEDYAGNSLEELQGWIDSARAKGFDQDAGDSSDQTLAAQAVRVAFDAGVQLFHDDETGWASVPSGPGVRTYAINSSGFHRWVRQAVYKALGRSINRSALSDAIATLEAEALFRWPKHPVEIRIGGDRTLVEIDLGHSDGRVVAVGPNGWEVRPIGTRKFHRASGFEPLPEPVREGNLEKLRTLLGLDETTFYLVLGFLVNALRPEGPYMALLVEGEQGSGKSFLSRVLKMLVDPNKAAKFRLPDNERDLMIQAKDHRLLVYDNASGVRSDMSDSLCSLATGAGMGVRRLYTNDELQVFAYARPIVINGISGYADRPDLLERSIPLRLKPMQVELRKTEDEMLKEFEELRPAILGVLYDAVACALRNYHSVYTPVGHRMADAARWIAAAEPALGIRQGAVLSAILDAQEELFVERINDDALVIAIREVLTVPGRNREFNGYVGELFKSFDPTRDKALPKTTQQLSKQLVRLRQAMAKAGLHVEFMSKDKKGRKIRIWSSIELDPPPYKPPISG